MTSPEVADRAKRQPRFWPVALAELTGLSPLALGVACTLAIGAVILTAIGAFAPDRFESQSDYISALGTGVFFTLLSAYSIAAINFVIDRQQRALDELRPSLMLTDQSFAATKDELRTSTPGFLLLYAALSLAGAGAHLTLLSHIGEVPIDRRMLEIPLLGSTIGTFVVWFVVTHVIALFMENTITISKLADDAKIDVLQPHALDGFGTIALLPTLGLIGMQMLYPLLSLGGFNAGTVLPGFVLTLGSLVYLFFRPLWPLHRRIAAAKADAIAAANAHIDAWRESGDGSLAELQPLLDHRDYLFRLSEWPFKGSTFGRWLFYLVVPLAAWVSSALVEIWLEGVLG